MLNQIKALFDLTKQVSEAVGKGVFDVANAAWPFACQASAGLRRPRHCCPKVHPVAGLA